MEKKASGAAADQALPGSEKKPHQGASTRRKRVDKGAGLGQHAREKARWDKAKEHYLHLRGLYGCKVNKGQWLKYAAASGR